MISHIREDLRLSGRCKPLCGLINPGGTCLGTSKVVRLVMGGVMGGVTLGPTRNTWEDMWEKAPTVPMPCSYLKAICSLCLVVYLY